MRVWACVALVALLVSTARADEPAGETAVRPAALTADDYLRGRLPDTAPVQGAGEKLDLGRGLRSQVAAELQLRIRSFVGEFKAALDADEPVLAVDALGPRYESFKAYHLLFLAGFDDAVKRIEERSLPQSYVDAVNAQRDLYEGRVGPLFTVLDSFYGERASERAEVAEEGEPGWIESYWNALVERSQLYAALAAIEVWLDTDVQPQPTLRASTLPYRANGTPARAPERASSPIVPTYQREGVEPGAEELAESAGIAFSDPLRLKAKELGFDSIRIFNFVRNQIRTEWYAGAVKGAELTLLSGSGNDVDQASLLIALLRLSGVPSHYVHGVVELPVEHLRNAFGVATDAEALRALALSGVAHEPIVRGGKVAAVAAERTWVALRLPYSNYRGTVVDPSGRIWLPVDPAFKRLVPVERPVLLGSLVPSAAARMTTYLAQDRPETLLDQLRVEAKTKLEQTASPIDYDALVASDAIEAVDSGYLPTTLPCAVQQVNAEESSLAPARTQQARFQVRSGSDPTSPVILDVTLPLSDLYNRRVTVSYIPASVEDHDLVLAFGGLTATPAYLVQVRPEVKVAGKVVATALQSMPLGLAHRLDLSLRSRGLEQLVTKTLVSGSYHALGLTLDATRLDLDAEDDPADTEFGAARILSQAVLRYDEAWETAEAELGALAGIALVRPLPSVAFASNAVEIAVVLDQPQQIAWNGVQLDAALRVVEPLRKATASAPSAEWFRLAALEGSVLEHQLFERDFLAESVSADKVIALARQGTLEVVQIDAQNAATQLPRLTHPPEVLAEISDRVFQGLRVTTPIAPLQHLDWVGSAWIAQDEQTGEAGYFLSGRIAGGATAVRSFGNGSLQALLQTPYTPGPNTDIGAAANVELIASTDGQTGTVGAPLPRPLAVRVTDATGRPVQGARVTFSIAAGAGDLAGGTTATRLSGPDGIARAAFTAGTITAVNPVFLRLEETDTWPTRLLLTFVDVSVTVLDSESRVRGTLIPRQPFTVLAHPGAATKVAAPEGGPFPVVPLQLICVTAQARDQYGNDVANAPVTFRYAGDDHVEVGQMPSVLTAGFAPGEVGSPDITEQGDTTIIDCLKPERKSASEQIETHHTAGARGTLIVGNANRVTYRYEMQVGQDKKELRLRADGGAAPCQGASLPPLPAGCSVLTETAGFERPAVRVGNAYPDLFQTKFYVYRTEGASGSVVVSKQPIIPRSVVKVEATDGGRVDGHTFRDGELEYQIRGGPTPALHDVTFEADFGEIVPTPPGCGSGGPPCVFSPVNRSFRIDTNVASLNPEVTDVAPSPLFIGGDKRSSDALGISYTVGAPTGYRADVVELQLLEAGRVKYAVRGSSLTGEGTASLPRGLEFEPTASYAVRVSVNPGSEIESPPVSVPLTRKLLTFVQKQVRTVVQVDALNQEACPGPFTISFGLSEPARVLMQVSSFGATSPTPINGIFGAGRQTVPLSFGDFGEGSFKFVLTATALSTGRVETGRGTIDVNVNGQAVPPTGHQMINGVDLFDGSLNLSRSDVSVAGRGSELDLVRTYKSSGAKDDESFLGPGWSHSYEVVLRRNSCGTVSAKGLKFFAEGSNFRPGKGHHATLRRTDADYDLFTKDGTRWHFRRFGFDTADTAHLEFIEDTNGNLTKLAYSPQGPDREAELALVEDSSGRRLEFEYASLGTLVRRLTRVRAPGEWEVQYGYDTRGRLIRVDRTRGDSVKTERYEYKFSAPALIENPADCAPDDIRCANLGIPDFATDAEAKEQNLLVAMVDPRGSRTEYTYQKANIFINDEGGGNLENSFVIQIKYPQGGLAGFQYGQRINRTQPLQTTLRDARNNVTVYELNQYGSATRIAHPAGQRTIVWTPDGIQTSSEVDELGLPVAWVYDEDGNLLSEKLANHAAATLTFVPLANGTIKNRVETRTDRNGHTTTTEYDPDGNLVRTVYPDSTEELNVYAENGDRIRRRDRRANWSEFTYDEHGNLESVVDALGNTTTNKWNDHGLLLETTDARGYTTRRIYDDLDRLVETVNPLGDRRRFTYDLNDNRISETDEEGRTTRWEYDAENRVIKETNALGHFKTYSYDLHGNLIREVDLRGKITTHEYDVSNRRIRTNWPGGRSSQFEYDAFGNLTREVRQLGRVKTYTYDDFKNRSSVTNALGQRSVYEHDQEANLVREVDDLGRVTELEYDALDRLRFRREPLGRVTEYRYDASGNKIVEISPNGDVTRMEYDALDRVVAVVDAEGGRWLTEYDAVGNVTRKIDPRGSVTTFEYDALNREIRRVDAEGNVFQRQYDRVGNVLVDTYPNGRVLTTRYDARNMPVEISDNLGLVATHEYDQNGNVLRTRDGRGFEVSYEYDDLNQRTRTTMPEGRVERTEYDVLGNVVKTIDPNGNETSFEYDLVDRIVREIDPFQKTIVTQYDRVGNPVEIKNKRGFSTLTRFDALNRPIEIEDAAGQVSRRSYDAVGNLVQEIDKRGIATRYAYDHKNRLLSVERASQRTVTNQYDAADNLAFVIDADGKVTGYEYDKLDRQTQINQELASITRSTYDQVGNRTSVRDPEGRFRVWAYDVRSQLIRETANGTSATNGTETTVYELDAIGNRTRVTRPRGNVWTFEYDGASRLVATTDPGNARTRYEYDRNDNLVAQVDALERRTTIDFDALDRPTRNVLPDGAFATFSYDENGNRTREINPNGVVRDHTYDVIDRRTRCDFGLPPVPTGKDLARLTWTYDANNNVVEALETYVGGSVPERRALMGYDDFDRMRLVTDAFGRTIRYSYDANGNRTLLVDPDGKTTTYTYDAQNRVSTVLNPSGVTRYSYDRSSRLTQVIYPNNTTSDRFYDAAGRTAVIDNRSNGSEISRFEYRYDLNGNPTQVLERNGHGTETLVFGFDNRDRLISAVYPPVAGEIGRDVRYTYDLVYNRTGIEIRNSQTQAFLERKSYTLNNRDQITRVDDLQVPSDSATYTYDASGNRTSKTKNGVETRFFFDARDHLRRITQGGSSIGEFLYDHRGLRVERIGNRGIERFSYDGGSILTQSDAANQTIARYEYGLERLVSMTHRTEGRSFYLFDALGSVVNQTATNGSIVTRRQYDAFGQPRRSSGESWNRFGFTGHEEEQESGLIFMKARYYDPDTATFLSADMAGGRPTEAPSLHRYLYVFANPVRYVDPLGADRVEAAVNEFVRASVRTLNARDADVQVTQRVLNGTVDSMTGTIRELDEANQQVLGVPDELYYSSGLTISAHGIAGGRMGVAIASRALDLEYQAESEFGRQSGNALAGAIWVSDAASRAFGGEGLDPELVHGAEAMLLDQDRRVVTTYESTATLYSQSASYIQHNGVSVVAGEAWDSTANGISSWWRNYKAGRFETTTATTFNATAAAGGVAGLYRTAVSVGRALGILEGTATGEAVAAGEAAAAQQAAVSGDAALARQAAAAASPEGAAAGPTAASQAEAKLAQKAAANATEAGPGPGAARAAEQAGPPKRVGRTSAPETPETRDAGKSSAQSGGSGGVRPATQQPVGGDGVVLRDGQGATAAEMEASIGGPTGGSRAGQAAVRQELLDETKASGEPYKCWRCGQTSTNPDDMHVGHRNVPTSEGGTLEGPNVCLEGAACNLSSGNRGGPSPGMSCAERGSCGAPYGR